MAKKPERGCGKKLAEVERQVNLVEQARSKARAGDCKGAMRLVQKAVFVRATSEWLNDFLYVFRRCARKGKKGR